MMRMTLLLAEDAQQAAQPGAAAKACRSELHDAQQTPAA
jgi:hypothetical protein